MNVVPSQTAHHAAVAGPIRATAAHSIAEAPNAPTHVHRFSGRPPRHAGMRSGGSGTAGRPGAGPRQGPVMHGRYAQARVD